MTIEIGIWALVVIGLMIFSRLGRLIDIVAQAPSHMATTQIEAQLKEIYGQIDKLRYAFPVENIEKNMIRIDQKLDRLIQK